MSLTISSTMICPSRCTLLDRLHGRICLYKWMEKVLEIRILGNDSRDVDEPLLGKQTSSTTENIAPYRQDRVEEY